MSVTKGQDMGVNPAIHQDRNLLTNSRISCLRRCPRMHYLKYEIGLTPLADEEYRLVGTLFHLCKNLDDMGHSDTAIVTIVRDRSIADQLVGEMAIRLWIGHRWYWAREEGNMEVLESEGSFRMPLINPETGRSARDGYSLGGQRDRVVRLADGRLALQEYKTTGRDIDPAAPYWRRLRNDSQISMYVRAARADGHDVETVLYDVTRRPASRPRLLTKGEIEVFDEGADAVKIEAGAWCGGNFMPCDRETETEEMFRHRQFGQPKAQKPRKLIARERVAFREGIDTPQIAPGMWFGEQFIPEAPIPVEDDEPGDKRYRESIGMYGARLNNEIATNPQRFFQRVDIARTDDELAAFDGDTWEQYQFLRACRKAGKWFRNADSCLDKGVCDYLDICGEDLDGSQPAPRGFKYSDVVHPELEVDSIITATSAIHVASSQTPGTESE